MALSTTKTKFVYADFEPNLRIKIGAFLPFFLGFCHPVEVCLFLLLDHKKKKDCNEFVINHFGERWGKITIAERRVGNIVQIENVTTPPIQYCWSLCVFLLYC